MMTSPFLNTGEACEFLRFIDAEGRPNREALRQFLLTKPDVKIYKRGRNVLLHRDDLEALLLRVK